ncbi:hypothetical protein KIPB_007373 [Kipferlia bialata]|uniref:Uncharacterized protein n=1 Tax=Kipferlia bialata TaxID=797122 RepID=A0A391NX05_9EUKA|nr:hypothetical protein KIPB_007373 [Kipferlia bialata]|eukprot:g7373.t1
MSESSASEAWPTYNEYILQGQGLSSPREEASKEGETEREDTSESYSWDSQYRTESTPSDVRREKADSASEDDTVGRESEDSDESREWASKLEGESEETNTPSVSESESEEWESEMDIAGRQYRLCDSVKSAVSSEVETQEESVTQSGTESSIATSSPTYSSTSSSPSGPPMLLMGYMQSQDILQEAARKKREKDTHEGLKVRVRRRRAVQESINKREREDMVVATKGAVKREGSSTIEEAQRVQV